jgi:hypothetical protein
MSSNSRTLPQIAIAEASGRFKTLHKGLPGLSEQSKLHSLLLQQFTKYKSYTPSRRSSERAKHKFHVRKEKTDFQVPF